MARLWIHRVSLCDIMVDFPSEAEAREWVQTFLRTSNEKVIPPQTGIDIGSTPTLQVSIHPPGFFHTQLTVYDGRTTWTPDSWNHRGTILVSADEALTLHTGEPDWFIPDEREDLQMKETRTVEELDEELDAYIYHDMPPLVRIE